MLDTFISTAPIYLSVLLGYIFKRKRILPENASKTVATIAFNVVVPFLIFNVLYGLKFTSENIHLVYFTFAIILLMLVTSYIYTKAVKVERPLAGSILGTSIGFGIGGFAYPFILANFDNNIFQNVVLVDIVQFIVMVNLGYTVIRRNGKK